MDTSNLIETYGVSSTNNRFTVSEDGFLYVYATVKSNTSVTLDGLIVTYENGTNGGSSLVIPVRKGSEHVIGSNSWSNVATVNTGLYGII